MSDEGGGTLTVSGELGSGFTQLPNRVLYDTSLALPAKYTYAVLLSMAWGKDRCWPGQERLSKIVGVDVRSIRRYITELETAGLLTTERRSGKAGLTNSYTLHLIPASVSSLDRTPVSSLDRTPTSYKEYEGEKHTKSNDTLPTLSPLVFDGVWLAVIDEALGGTTPLLAGEKKSLAAACWEIVKAGHTGDDVRQHARRMRDAGWKPGMITPHSITKHWAKFEKEVGNGNTRVAATPDAMDSWNQG
jgi:helix-turn-helix protein